MKQYRLLKDLPDLKKGTVLSLDKSIFGLMKILTIGNKDVGPIFISNAFFGELFEEIQELTDSIHWKPKIGDKCFILENNNIRHTNYTGMVRDYNAYITGRVFRFEKEAIAAANRELAEIRLRRTSNFKPDWEDGLQIKYVVIFNHVMNRLEVHELTFEDLGLPVYFESEVSAMKSIRENEQDWKIYFGIEEEE